MGRPAERVFQRGVGLEREFDQIRSYLSADPGVLGDRAAGMHIRCAGLDVSRNVRMARGDLELGGHAVRVPLQWADARRPKLFPVLETTLEITPATGEGPPLSQIDLAGRYRLPFGPLGAIVAALGGHRLLVEAIDRFLSGLADRLEGALPPDPVRSGFRSPTQEEE